MEQRAVPASLGLTPEWFPFNMDPASDRVLLLRKRPDDYRAASFLDQRWVTAQDEQRIVGWRAVVEAIPASARRDAQFIFHIGHVGSTLISRLLGELPAVFALREPLLLRVFAGQDEDWRRERIPALIALLSRTFGPEQRALVKATSFTSEIAAALAPPGSRALFAFATAPHYIESILAGDASRQELAFLAPSRRQRLAARCPEIDLGSVPATAAAEAAVAWACEMASLEANAAHLQDAVAWIDFDRFLEAPVPAFRSMAAHFGAAVPSGAAEAICGGPLMRRYSKALEYEYSPALRRDLLAESRRLHGAEINAALGWLEAQAERSPLLSKALARSAQ